MCVSVCPCGPGTCTLICLSGCGIHLRQKECRQGRSLGSQSRLWRLCLQTAHVSKKLMGAGTGAAAGTVGGGDISVVSPPTGASAAATVAMVSAAVGSSALALLVAVGLTALLTLTSTSTTATVAAAAASTAAGAATAPPSLPSPPSMAAALVEEETRRYRPTKNYLSYLQTPDFATFETEIMRNEFERLAARQPMDLLSMKRYELPAPSSGQKNDITAWQECVNNSMAQLEHQAVRIENLELMSQYGTNAWKVYNDNLAFMIEMAQKELQKFRKQIQDLNWQRKNDQLAGGAKLRELESNWVSLVSKNFEIERAIIQLENEVTQLRQQQGDENKENIRQDF
uniref:Pre-mRNA-splicing factor SPF27 n=1 Tax=Cyclopterus lumpus TaxID=8103 RepID=A0A8C2XP09_CYCLU